MAFGMAGTQRYSGASCGSWARTRCLTTSWSAGRRLRRGPQRNRQPPYSRKPVGLPAASLIRCPFSVWCLPASVPHNQQACAWNMLLLRRAENQSSSCIGSACWVPISGLHGGGWYRRPQYSNLLSRLMRQALHIGDSLAADIKGGINAGLAATVWVSQKPCAPPRAPQPSYIVSHVTQLPSVLQRMGVQIA